MPSSGTGPFWSVIVPVERANLVKNPSFEFGTAGWAPLGLTSAVGSVSGTAVQGAWSLKAYRSGGGALKAGEGAQFGTVINLSSYTYYTLSAYVYSDKGSVALVAGNGAGGTSADVSSNKAWAAGSSSGWMRLTTGPFIPLLNVTIPSIVAHDGPLTGSIYVDSVQVELGSTFTTYIDGDQPGCSWQGDPHASDSYRSGDTRLGGSVVRFDDIGFTVDTSPGIGAPPFNTLSQSYAQLDGAEFQKQRKNVRRFTLTSLVDGTSWGDLHYQRRRLIEAIRIENTPTQQPMRLLYSGAGGTLAIDAVWDGGVQFGADGQSFAEGIVASFTAYDPDWKDTLQEGTTLRDQDLLSNMTPLVYRDPMGRWGNLTGLSYDTSSIFAINESLDGGTVYTALNDTTLIGGKTRGLIYFDKVGGAGLLGNGTITGPVYDLEWDLDKSRLLIGGSLDRAGGTVTGQLAFWNPTANTFGSVGWIGTGTRIDATQAITDCVINAIVPWSYGTYYLGGGPFHRVNGVLVGTNWSILRWDGAVGGYAAADPVSVNGTGFVDNGFWNTGGSRPGIVQSLTRFSQTQMIVGAFGNTLRGFGTGISAALYDVRGTWGTIPGYRVPMDIAARAVYDGYRAPDRSAYLTGVGTTTVGTLVAKVQGLTASGLGSITGGTALAIAADDDTVAWIGGTSLQINNLTYAGAIVRTNGYDYQPGDLVVDRNCITIFRSPSNGTTYFGFAYMGAAAVTGTAAAVGTIVNRGMSNVYPTLRMRNTSSGTIAVRQWANMTTKEYVWFNLFLLPGESVELTTGPGRVAFQSSYRGDILGNIVGGSKLASWHLIPGQNLVSFLADNPAVTADMYWNPRYHSADGTGII